MANKRGNLKDSMKEGLSALVSPTVPVNTREAEEPAPVEKKRYKTCNYVTDPSHHRRLKNYATDNGMTLLEAFNKAIDLYLSDKGERYL
jgi:hypothetical protein